ncbi:MAG: hypothetical protein N3A38_02675 [Planctomycetota bacterium]|nr:hypothetical protein [Planctomycetota bacterium]
MEAKAVRPSDLGIPDSFPLPKRKERAGFVGFGEVNTPRDIVERLCGEARARLEKLGLQLVWTAPVSDDPDGRDVARARRELAADDFDVLVACVSGWIPSHAIIGVVDAFRHKPMILWGLTGWEEGGRWVTTAGQAGTTAIRRTMEEMGYRFKYVFDTMNGGRCEYGILSFARAAQAAGRLRGARIGSMGYRDMHLYATLHDGVSLRAKVGPEVEVFDMLEIERLMKALDPAQVASEVAAARSRWTFESPARDETVARAVRLYLAVRRKIEERGYEAVSLVDVDGVKKFFGFPPAAAFMLLHDEAGVCTIPENDIMGAVSQLIVRYLTGQAAPYLEFYEFLERGVLLGVPDYVPSEAVDGPVIVRPAEFGGLGEGLMNVSRLKTGTVTICRLFRSTGRYGLHAAVGEARTPRRWEEAGWKPPAPRLPGLEVDIGRPIAEFAGNVAGQHYILAYGDISGQLRDICALLGMEFVA